MTPEIQRYVEGSSEQIYLLWSRKAGMCNGVGLKCIFLLGRSNGGTVDAGEDRRRKELSLLANPP